MNDLIKRQDAIDAVMKYGKQIPTFAIAVKDALENLPSAQPERKKGKWDFMGWQMFQCSECKHTFTQDFLEGWREYTYESHFPPFCPNCGSCNGGEHE